MLEASLPRMLEDALRVGLDCVMPPPKLADCSKRQADALAQLEARTPAFELVYTPQKQQRADRTKLPRPDANTARDQHSAGEAPLPHPS